MNSFFASLGVQHPPLPTIRHDEPQRNSPSELGESRHSHSAMSDEEREQAAYRAGVAMQAAYSQYQHSGNAAHLDRAHRHLGQMLALVKGRTE